MNYQQLGFLWLAIGGSGVAVGSVVCTLGWNWQGDKEKTRWWHRRWWAVIVVGFLLAGFGGIASTWGWDSFNKQSQMNALAFALCREIITNRAKVNMHPCFDPNFGAAYDGRTWTPLPTFETDAAKKLFASDLPKDGRLLMLCASYIHYGDTCDRWFDSISDAMKIQIKLRIHLATSIRDHGIVTGFQKSQDLLFQYFLEHYPTQAQHAVSLIRRMDVLAFVDWLESADPNGNWEEFKKVLGTEDN